MQYDRQLTTRELQIDEIWSALRAVLRLFEKAGLKEADILFGWGWTHKKVDWDYLRCRLSEIEPRIRAEEREEQAENQTFGRRDVFLRHPSLPFEVQFCHELDLHIWWLENPAPLVAEIAADWQEKGLNPRSFIKKNSTWVEQPFSTSSEPRGSSGLGDTPSA